MKKTIALLLILLVLSLAYIVRLELLRESYKTEYSDLLAEKRRLADLVRELQTRNLPTDTKPTESHKTESSPRPVLRKAYLLPKPPDNQGRFIEYESVVEAKDAGGKSYYIVRVRENNGFVERKFPASDIRFQK